MMHSFPSLSVWLQAIRPKTLAAGAIPVCVAAAHALHEGVFAGLPVLLCLVFALLIQVGTNFANDYYDGVKGADDYDRLGPARAVASGLVTPAQMLRATVFTLLVAFVVGLGLIFYGGWWLLPLGLVCILLAIAYTGGPFPLAYLGLGDVFVVLFFGLVPVMITYYVQAGTFSGATFWTGLACGLLATNLLVVNNYRDAEGDARAHKRTLVVRWGRPFARKQYVINVLVALLVPIILLFYGYSWWLLLSVLLMAPSGLLLSVEFARSSPQYCNVMLAKTAVYLLAYGALLSLIMAVT